MNCEEAEERARALAEAAAATDTETGNTGNTMNTGNTAPAADAGIAARIAKLEARAAELKTMLDWTGKITAFCRDKMFGDLTDQLARGLENCREVVYAYMVYRMAARDMDDLFFLLEKERIQVKRELERLRKEAGK